MGKRLIIVSGIVFVIGLVSMFYFGNRMDQVGTYETIELLYMLISQGVCGLGFIGLIIGLTKKDTIQMDN